MREVMLFFISGITLLLWAIAIFLVALEVGYRLGRHRQARDR
jgi:hypothetical protein